MTGRETLLVNAARCGSNYTAIRLLQVCTVAAILPDDDRYPDAYTILTYSRAYLSIARTLHQSTETTSSPSLSFPIPSYYVPLNRKLPPSPRLSDKQSSRLLDKRSSPAAAVRPLRPGRLQILRFMRYVIAISDHVGARITFPLTETKIVFALIFFLNRFSG